MTIMTRRRFLGSTATAVAVAAGIRPAGGATPPAVSPTEWQRVVDAAKK